MHEVDRAPMFQCMFDNRVNHPTGYEPVDPLIHSTISSSLGRQWTVGMHDHIVID